MEKTPAQKLHDLWVSQGSPVSSWSKDAARRRRNRWWRLPLAKIQVRYYMLKRKLKKLCRL